MTWPSPRLFGVNELCERWGITKQAIAKRRRDDPLFPLPHQTLTSGPVWTLAQVVEYEAASGREPVTGTRGARDGHLNG